jgi:hypothetical protein
VEEDEMGETCGMHGAVNAFKILVWKRKETA